VVCAGAVVGTRAGGTAGVAASKTRQTLCGDTTPTAIPGPRPIIKSSTPQRTVLASRLNLTVGLLVVAGGAGSVALEM